MTIFINMIKKIKIKKNINKIYQQKKIKKSY